MFVMLREVDGIAAPGSVGLECVKTIFKEQYMARPT